MAHLEGAYEQISERLSGIDGRLTALDQKIDSRFDALDRKMESKFEDSDSSFLSWNKKMTNGLIAGLLHRECCHARSGHWCSRRSTSLVTISGSGCFKTLQARRQQIRRCFGVRQCAVQTFDVSCWRKPRYSTSRPSR